jgi:hypothetical protein
VSSYPKALVVTRKKPTHTTLVSGDLLSVAGQNLIRRAYKSGQRKLMYKDREFTITRKGDHLLVKPVLGRLPLAQIQIESGPTKKLQKWSEAPVEPNKQAQFKRSAAARRK